MSSRACGEPRESLWRARFHLCKGRNQEWIEESGWKRPGSLELPQRRRRIHGGESEFREINLVSPLLFLYFWVLVQIFVHIARSTCLCVFRCRFFVDLLGIISGNTRHHLIWARTLYSSFLFSFGLCSVQKPKNSDFTRVSRPIQPGDSCLHRIRWTVILGIWTVFSVFFNLSFIAYLLLELNSHLMIVISTLN